MNNFIFILGSGGSGKSHLATSINRNTKQLDPIRFRDDGPKGKNDKFYAPSTLYNEIIKLLDVHNSKEGDILRGQNQHTKFYMKDRVFTFKTEESFQMLFLPLETETNSLFKLEVFAQAVPFLLEEVNIETTFDAKISFMLLNPSKIPIENNDSISEIKSITRNNCKMRSEKFDEINSEKSIMNRINAVEKDIITWRYLQGKYPNSFYEFTEWKYPEHIYNDENKDQITKEINVLISKTAPELNIFFN